MPKNKRRSRKKKTKSKHVAVTARESRLGSRMAVLLARMSGTTWLGVGAGSVLLTIFAALLTLYPWLSIQQDGSIDSGNPFGSMFSLANDGYLPVFNVGGNCVFGSFELTGRRPASKGRLAFDQNTLLATAMATVLYHSQRVTVPCFRSFNYSGRERMVQGGSLEVNVNYSFLPLVPSVLERTQTFHFSAVPDETGQVHWAYDQ